MKLDYWWCSIIALLGGVVLDLLIGDPQWVFHPVRLIGMLIEKVEKIVRNIGGTTNKGLLFAGKLLVVLVILVVGIISVLLVYLSFEIHFLVNILVQMVMCYFLLAMKSLKTESMKVYHGLKKDGVMAGRQAVSMIVGRDTNNLDEQGIVKATVETIAENLSDGVIAPYFYMVLGGPVLGFIYKAMNTMDSMVGYKNDKYLYLGRCAAKIDDIVNFLPSRFAALCIIIAAPIIKLRGANAWRIFKRDRFCHASPNSAQTEAAAAGALGVQLGGNAWYFGKLHEKQTIGDSEREIETEDIVRMNKLMYTASFLAFFIMGAVKTMVLAKLFL